MGGAGGVERGAGREVPASLAGSLDNQGLEDPRPGPLPDVTFLMLK
jgi:hypothetical protein